MKHTVYSLENGAQLITIPLQGATSVTAMVMYPVGSRYEPEPLSGVSHYIEHIMFKGTQKRPSPLVLTREIDRLGAEYNAFTGKEYTGYYIKADKTHLDTSLDILSDMLGNSSFDAEEMEREKGVIIEEIKMYNDNPLMNIDNVFEEVMFTGALGRDIAGTAAHVSAYKRDDVLAYRDKHYHPGNMTIVIAGDIDDSINELVEKYFGTHDQKNIGVQEYESADFVSRENRGHIKVDQKDLDQAQLMIGFPAYKQKDKEKNITLSVLNTILGGSMSSRLFMEIRERRGLAYMVRSGADKFRDLGYAYIRAGLDTKNINDAISVSVEETQKLVNTAVTADELADAKTRIQGLLALSHEDSSNVVMWYAKQALFMDSIESPQEYLEKMKKVTAEDIQNIATEVFKPDQLRIAVIGSITPDSIKH